MRGRHHKGRRGKHRTRKYVVTLARRLRRKTKGTEMVVLARKKALTRYAPLQRSRTNKTEKTRVAGAGTCKN